MFKYQYFTRLREQKSTSKCCIDVFFIVSNIRLCNTLIIISARCLAENLQKICRNYTPKYHLTNLGLSPSFNFSTAAV